MRTKRGLRYATSYDFGSNISFEREKILDLGDFPIHG